MVDVGRHGQQPSIIGVHGGGDARVHDAHAARDEADRRDDVRTHRDAVRECRYAEPRRDLPRRRRAARMISRLDHDRAQTGAREQRRADEPVGSGADHHGPCRHPLSTISAALRPGAPMMPPPGCVADPHMTRLSIGVRYCAQPGTGRRKNSCSSESSPWKMLPSDKPHSRSRSSGVTTWRCRMMSFRFGAYSAIVSTTASPKASRCSSHLPSARWNGAYCTKHDITCLPGGATVGSLSEGMTMSMYGRRENRPYFASSNARSM